MFLLPQSTNRGDLRSAGISRFIARPLRLHRSPSLATRPSLTLFLHWIRYSGTSIAGDSPRAPCSSLAWLLACLCTTRCCLRPRGVGFALVSIALTAWPALGMRGSALPKLGISRGYVSDSGLHPSPRRTRYSPLGPPGPSQVFATGRLTNLTRGGLGVVDAFLLNMQPLPGYPFPIPHSLFPIAANLISRCAKSSLIRFRRFPIFAISFSFGGLRCGRSSYGLFINKGILEPPSASKCLETHSFGSDKEAQDGFAGCFSDHV